MLNTSYCVKACDPVVARIFGDSQVAEKHTSDLMGRRFRNPWVRRLDPSLIPFPKTGQGYTKFPVNYIFLSVNRFFLTNRFTMRPALLLLVFIGIFGMLTNFIIYNCVSLFPHIFFSFVYFHLFMSYQGTKQPQLGQNYC